MEDDLKKKKRKKLKTNQSTKINLIGCDTIVNSPSIHLFTASQYLALKTTLAAASLMGETSLILSLIEKFKEQRYQNNFESESGKKNDDSLKLGFRTIVFYLLILLLLYY
jgi:hypothetical protein